jgi:hypothetical protein
MTAEVRTLRAHALLLGERLDLRALSATGIEATENSPIAFEDGASAVLFRCGASASLARRLTASRGFESESRPS